MAFAFSRKRLLAQTFDDDYENDHITKYTKFTWFIDSDDVDAFYHPAKGEEFAEIDDFAELAAAIANYQMECDDEMNEEKMDDCEYMEIINKEEHMLNDLSKFIIWK